MQYALVKDGVVVNLVEWDGVGDIFNGMDAVVLNGERINPGWVYTGGVFSDPNVTPNPDDSALYDIELSAINAQYESEKNVLAQAYLNAGLFDGVAEQQKKSEIYQKLTTLNASYDQQVSALDVKYGG